MVVVQACSANAAGHGCCQAEGAHRRRVPGYPGALVAQFWYNHTTIAVGAKDGKGKAVVKCFPLHDEVAFRHRRDLSVYPGSSFRYPGAPGGTLVGISTQGVSRALEKRWEEDAKIGLKTRRWQGGVDELGENAAGVYGGFDSQRVTVKGWGGVGWGVSQKSRFLANVGI
eukprot:1257990-Rhodomonas_salina.4